MKFYSRKLCFFLVCIYCHYLWTIHPKLIIQISWKSKRKNWLNFDWFLANRGKSEDVDDKIWKNEYGFWTFHPKIRLDTNFHEHLRENLTDFWLIEINEDDKSLRKRKLSTLNLAYIPILWKCGKLFFEWFLTNKGKNEDDDKNRKSSAIFELSIPKFGDLKILIKNWEKKMF